MSSDCLQDTAIITSKLATNYSLPISLSSTIVPSNMNTDVVETSASRGKNSGTGKKKNKSPKVFRRRRSQDRSRTGNNIMASVIPLEQQNGALTRRFSNPKHIKFALNRNQNSLARNFIPRVYTNSGFSTRIRRVRSNSDMSFNPGRSNQPIKPGMSNDFVSREVMEYYQRNRQSNEKYKAKQILRQSLENTLKQSFPNYFINLHIIGSTTNGIGDNVSTVDICVLARKKLTAPQVTAINDKKEDKSGDSNIEHSTKTVDTNEEKIISEADSTIDNNDDLALKHIEKILQSKNFAQNIILIPAKVPVIKFTDTICNLNVTLNLNQEVSIRNTQLLRDYSRMDWRFPQLAMIVKQWARENRINSAVDKSISPYSWTLMVIHYLQVVEPPVLPCLQKMVPQRYNVNVNMEDEMNCWRQHPIEWHSKNQNTLKQLLKGLFRYFSYVFDYDQHIISVREGKVLNRIYTHSNRSNGNYDENAIQWNALMCVEEPFTRNNTTRSVHDVDTFERIKELLRISSNALKGNRISLFNIIIDDLDFPIQY